MLLETMGLYYSKYCIRYNNAVPFLGIFHLNFVKKIYIYILMGN